MTTPTRGPDSHPELVWLFNHSAAEVGLHSQGVPQGDGGSHSEPQGPSVEQMRAARRQSRDLRCLRALCCLDRNVLAVCYRNIEVPRNVVNELGLPLARVAHFVAQSGADRKGDYADALRGLVVRAHDCFERALAHEKAELAEQAASSSRPADVTEFIESEVDCKGVPLMDKHEQDVMHVAAWVRLYLGTGGLS
jgi:hypothetical protein